MKEALIIIDYQYDFVAEDGLLTVGQNARDIADNIYSLALECLDKNKDIIFTLDSHNRENWVNHPESKSFNIHCEKGTKGQEPYGKLNDIKEKCIIIEKKGYCIDTNDLDDIVNKYDDIILCGVVTDICVLQTAIALYNAYVNKNKKVKLKLKKSACASFDNDKHNFAIDYMKNILGMEII